MADKLAIYRGALRLLGDAHSLSSLSEVGPARQSLDQAWDGAVAYLLAKGLWNFAMRTVVAEADPSATTAFGYDYVFAKPDDWVRTASIGDDGDFSVPTFRYDDVAGYWMADIDTLYIKYVSNDDAYGLNVGSWREPFAKTVEAYLAFECGLPISSDRGNRNDLYSLFKARLKDAKALDAVDERVQTQPMSRLVQSRFSGNWRDRR